MSVPSYGSSLTDPAGSGALVAAVAWLQGTLLGTVATTVAVVAIASVGFGMLTGRMDLRRGITVITGCFILFGATSIVAGLQATMLGTGSSEITYPPPIVQVPAPRAAFGSPSARYDPYAGASVPSE